MSATITSVDQLAINTIRTLSMDAVQEANSGHPGTPMALAPVAYTLWNEFLDYDPADPTWPGRDRFVLSCGHASMLLYSLLHLSGTRQVDHEGRTLDEPAVTLEEIRDFRQFGSRTPGHPEFRETGGVETTTGPLGQGVANSVGMAIASGWLGSHFNRPGFSLFDFNVYALCGDGDMMEGVTCEAASLAGHLKLSNLCWIYDDNQITIEGNTDLAFSENVAQRFEGLGWNVLKVDDANDIKALAKAYREAGANDEGPTLIIVRSVIGYGAPNKQNTHGAHGAPLGEEEIRLAKASYGWPEDDKFVVPDEVYEQFQDGIGRKGRESHRAWNAKYEKYCDKHPALAAEWEMLRSGDLPEGWDQGIPTFDADAKGMATRASSGQVLNAIAKRVPWLIGGSADLAPSNNTELKFEEAGEYSAATPGGRNFHFGIREHAMAAALNGIATTGIRPYGGTFFVFTDYMRPSMRLAGLMKLPVLYVLTHDSIGVGEDGPTHQPVEHLSAARAIPGLAVVRPGDANEVAEAYRTIMRRNNEPTALVLTRQALPTLDREKYAAAEGVAYGGYILADAADGKPEVILIGTGSEVSLCVAAHEQLTTEGIKSRVVSMPSWEWFEEQTDEYRETVLPLGIRARVAVEAGLRHGWDKYLGLDGAFVGMTGFGASAPGGKLMEHFGLTVENVVENAKALIGKN